MKQGGRKGAMEDRSHNFKCVYGGPMYLSLSARLTLLT